jgi:hypothetical protein
MTEAAASFAGNLTDDPELRYTDGGIARAMFRVAVSGRREQEASFFTVVVGRDQAEPSFGRSWRLRCDRCRDAGANHRYDLAAKLLQAVAEQLGRN